MTDDSYCFSQDYELAVTVLTISVAKDLMQMAYGTKEPRTVIERAIKEIMSDGGIWEDAITFYPVSAIIGYRLVEMDQSGKDRLSAIRKRMKEEKDRLHKAQIAITEQNQTIEPKATEAKAANFAQRLFGKR